MSENVERALSYLGEKPKGGAKRVLRQPHAVVPTVSFVAIRRLAEKLDVSTEQVLSVSDISVRTYARRQEKQEPLTEAESDRVLRIARVASIAERVFGDPDKARRWLSANSAILGAAPLDLLGTDAGSRDVEDELVRIEFGDFA